jgi:hypothetical protein
MSNFDNEQITRYTSVGGWLLLFCLGLTIFSPLLTIFNLVTTYEQTYQFFDQYPGFQTIYYVDGFLSTILMLLSIRAGIALWGIKPGAVQTAKTYLLLFLGYTVVAIFLPFMAGLPSSVNDAMIPEVVKGAIKSVVYVAIWYSYLNVSKRVHATYTTYSIPEESLNISSEPETSEVKNETETAEVKNETETEK